MSSAPQFNPARRAQAKPPVTRSHFPAWAVAVLLAVITLALYWPATHYDFINYDDPDYVTGNIHVTTGLSLKNIGWAFSNSVTGNWHPLTMISHMLDCQLFGVKPGGQHLTSGLFHALNTALVFLWLRGLTGAVWRSALVAALFGWHPLNVEAVAWIAERKSVLSLCFGLLALLFYTAYARRPTTGKSWGASRWYWAAWFCLALGLMCKSILVTWPLVFLLLDYWPLARFRSIGPWPLIKEKIPGFALVAAVSIITIWTHEQEGDLLAADRLPVAARLENALISYGRYLGKLFWPTDLAVFYPHPGYWPVAQVGLAGLILAGVTLLAIVARRRHPFLLFGWLWFVGTLVPVIGLVQVGAQAMADRHAYIPSLGIWIMTVWGVYELAVRCRVTGTVMALAAAVALVSGIALTHQQLAYWQNSETLFRHALAVTRNNSTAHNNLGTALDNQGRTSEAVGEFREAIRIKPDNAAAYYNLGNVLAKQGQTDAAISQFQEAARFNPDYADAHNNLGSLLAKQGQTAAAISQFQEAIRLQPDDAGAHYNLGNSLLKTGRVDEAAAQFQETIRLTPDFAPGYYNLGVALEKTGKSAEAMAQLQAAIRLKPDYAVAHNSLGIVFMSQGRVDEAIEEFETAVRLKPDYMGAQYNLTRALDVKNNPPAQAPVPAKP